MKLNKTDMEKDHAREQALAHLESIKEMVARLEHTNNADTPGEVPERCTEYCETDYGTPERNAMFQHDGSTVMEQIQNSALEVLVRSDWADSSESWDIDQYTILLSTGGPAVRIKGRIGGYDAPESAQLEYQDWGTPWTRLEGLTSEDIDALITYSGCFYFS